MTTTMQLIAKQTVGAAGASSITFSNIPQTYTDLQVVVSLRSNRSATTDALKLNFNGSTTNYSGITLYGTGSGTGSENNNDQFSQPQPFLNTYAVVGATATASTFSNASFYITNYTSSNNKSVSIDYVTENNATSVFTGLTAGLWSNSSAINAITFTPVYGTAFQAFSEVCIYGISNSTTVQATTVPFASGGDIITNDGTYWYHTFLYSGTFTPLKNLTCDYLVVAGGGGGGTFYAAGGGAGGLRSTVTATGGGGSLETPLSLTANTAYTAQIGSGGAGATTNSQLTGFNGGNSIFATITSIGGGGGASENQPGANGGSGGGGSYTAQIGGTGTANQGYGGGTGSPNVASGRAAAGGGGGAGQAGTNSPNYDNGGAGGNGVAVSITGSSVTYAGGGGGGIGFNSTGSRGLGGSGGGGNGGNASSQNGGNGTANLGAGGGGAFGNSVIGPIGGNGGSGIIVVRYAV